MWGANEIVMNTKVSSNYWTGTNCVKKKNQNKNRPCHLQNVFMSFHECDYCTTSKAQLRSCLA